MTKVTVWNLEDELKDKWAMVKFMQAVCEEVTNPVKDIDFEYFILECQRLPEIAKRKRVVKMIYKELKVMLKQYEVAIKALEKIADPKYTMRMVEAQRALEKIKRLEKRKNDENL